MKFMPKGRAVELKTTAHDLILPVLNNSGSAAARQSVEKK